MTLASMFNASAVALRKESVDRNCLLIRQAMLGTVSLSARRAWIEISDTLTALFLLNWSLSARRAWIEMALAPKQNTTKQVALRKESVDRNAPFCTVLELTRVALRKESVDRNAVNPSVAIRANQSLSARRAWIEMFGANIAIPTGGVALRKESVDRNHHLGLNGQIDLVALRKESVDRNFGVFAIAVGFLDGRSPQGERG